MHNLGRSIVLASLYTIFASLHNALISASRTKGFVCSSRVVKTCPLNVEIEPTGANVVPSTVYSVGDPDASSMTKI